MSADYRNLLISRNRIDWKELKLFERGLYDIYEMKISKGYAYFVYTTNHHILHEEYLPYYKPTVILIYHNDCGTGINLLDYTGNSVIKVDSIDDDFIYDNDPYYIDSFIELLEPALIKVSKNMELDDQTLLMIATIFRSFTYGYDELSGSIKSRLIKLY